MAWKCSFATTSCGCFSPSRTDKRLKLEFETESMEATTRDLSRGDRNEDVDRFTRLLFVGRRQLIRSAKWPFIEPLSMETMSVNLLRRQ